MPIDTRCPHCQKAYRLKDEFLGKKVKCPNGDCARPFTVEPVPVESAPKPKSSPAPRKTAAELEREAEALAASMFGEEAAPTAEDTRTVEMKCASCDRVWSVGYDKRGKFVICPECGFRQKVADKKAEKKIDWRDPNANRPSLAKSEEVPDDLRKQMSRDASTGALVEAGVIKEEIEPVPLAVKLKRVAAVLAGVAVIGFVVLYFLQSRQEGKEQRFLDDALAEVDKITDEGLTKGQPALFKAILLAAAAEHALRNDTPEGRKLAQERFGAARQLVDQQSPRSPDRDLVLGELAVLIAKFGGDDEQVGKEIRLRWKPAERGANSQLNSGMGDVQTELKRVLTSLSNADLDLRLWAARRTARELNKKNQVEPLLEILNQGFAAEMAEACATVGLELSRAGNTNAAKLLAGEAKGSLPANTPHAATQVLCEITGVAFDFKLKPTDYSYRNYQAILAAMNKDTAGAVAAATRDGQADDKLRLLALVADWSENPSEVAAKAESVLTNEGRGKSNASVALIRLAAAAGKSGQMDVAEKLVAGIADEGLRAWARTEVVRGKLESGKEKADLAQVEQSTEKLKLRVGHVWMAAVVARHNAALSGDQSVAKEYSSWTDPAFKGCALASLALGIQDRKK